MATTPTQPTQQRNPERMHAVQHIEITATEPKKLRSFLEKQFGWKFETHTMEGGVEYNLFRTPDGNGGGVMAPMPGQPIATTPYINVADIEKTFDSVKKAGAEIMMPVSEVPGQGRFFIFRYGGGPALACWQQTGPRN
jgi:predicted enzyme related to lactoylglutathione lyase